MQPIRYLTLWPTSSCNLECAYCYRQVRTGVVMPQETALAALQLAASSGLPFHVQLAGGEPTLVPDRIRAIVEHVRRSEWPATLALQTNGVNLDVALARFCRDHEVELGISLDGPLPIQQMLRGRATDTLRALALTRSENVPVRITTVLTAANAPHLKELALVLAGFPNVRGLALDPLVQLGSALQRPDLRPSPDALRDGIRALYETLQFLEPMRNQPFHWRERELVRKARAGRVSADYCHACRGESLAVTPDGEVYPCAQAIGDRSLAAGTVWNVDWEILKRGFGNAPMTGPCETCSLRGRCPGDCPSRLRHSSATSQSAACLMYRTIAELEST